MRHASVVMHGGMQAACPPCAGASFELGRWGTTDDIAEVVALLVSERGKWLTGVNYRVDGGMTARRPSAPHRSASAIPNAMMTLTDAEPSRKRSWPCGRPRASGRSAGGTRG
ncbi:SDR family oxidoreductase [Corallococcus exercitus]|uniref:SDR family oxidoreductase n=1 Tax=Corallococcus exercitus TaxID=2316736 RepID=UPI0034DE5B21